MKTFFCASYPFKDCVFSSIPVTLSTRVTGESSTRKSPPSAISALKGCLSRLGATDRHSFAQLLLWPPNPTFSIFAYGQIALPRQAERRLLESNTSMAKSLPLCLLWMPSPPRVACWLSNWMTPNASTGG